MQRAVRIDVLSWLPYSSLVGGSLPSVSWARCVHFNCDTIVRKKTSQLLWKGESARLSAAEGKTVPSLLKWGGTSATTHDR
jgi:hypothetical protein